MGITKYSHYCVADELAQEYGKKPPAGWSAGGFVSSGGFRGFRIGLNSQPQALLPRLFQDAYRAEHAEA